MSKVIQIAVAKEYVIALRDDGTIWSFSPIYKMNPWVQIPTPPIFCTACEEVKPQFLDTGLCQPCHADNGE